MMAAREIYPLKYLTPHWDVHLLLFFTVSQHWANSIRQRSKSQLVFSICELFLECDPHFLSFVVCLSKVAASYSKTWSYREDALLTVYKKLMEVPPGTPKAELRSMMRAAVFLCKKALTDKVSSVRELSLLSLFYPFLWFYRPLILFLSLSFSRSFSHPLFLISLMFPSFQSHFRPKTERHHQHDW